MGSEPILCLKPHDAPEGPGIVRDEGQPQRDSMSSHEGVERADRLAAPSQCGRDYGEATCSGLTERDNLHGLYERADQTVEFPWSSGLGAEAQVGEGGRADAEFRAAGVLAG